MNYSDILSEALLRSCKAVRRSSSYYQGKRLGRGAFGDTTYGFDRIAEEAVVDTISEHLPGARIISEEAGFIGPDSSTRIVLVDPIDGSTNAVCSIPFYSTAIAIAEGPRFSDIRAAGVIDIVHEKLIVGEKGHGVWSGEERAALLGSKGSEDLCVCFDLKFQSFSPQETATAVKLLKQFKHPRSLGSAALETALVATGAVDAFVELAPRLRTFDCVPSLFLVEEVGGFIHRFGGRLEDVDLTSTGRLGYVAAGSRQLGEEIVKIVGEAERHGHSHGL